MPEQGLRASVHAFTAPECFNSLTLPHPPSAPAAGESRGLVEQRVSGSGVRYGFVAMLCFP